MSLGRRPFILPAWAPYFMAVVAPLNLPASTTLYDFWSES
jgi:hypothetical protein